MAFTPTPEGRSNIPCWSGRLVYTNFQASTAVDADRTEFFVPAPSSILSDYVHYALFSQRLPSTAQKIYEPGASFTDLVADEFAAAITNILTTIQTAYTDVTAALTTSHNSLSIPVNGPEGGYPWIDLPDELYDEYPEGYYPLAPIPYSWNWDNLLLAPQCEVDANACIMNFYAHKMNVRVDDVVTGPSEFVRVGPWIPLNQVQYVEASASYGTTVNTKYYAYTIWRNLVTGQLGILPINTESASFFNKLLADYSSLSISAVTPVIGTGFNTPTVPMLAYRPIEEGVGTYASVTTSPTVWTTVKSLYIDILRSVGLVIPDSGWTTQTIAEDYYQPPQYGWGLPAGTSMYPGGAQYTDVAALPAGQIVKGAAGLIGAQNYYDADGNGPYARHAIFLEVVESGGYSIGIIQQKTGSIPSIEADIALSWTRIKNKQLQFRGSSAIHFEGPIVELPFAEREPDPIAYAEITGYGYIPADSTIYRKTSRRAPGAPCLPGGSVTYKTPAQVAPTTDPTLPTTVSPGPYTPHTWDYPNPLPIPPIYALFQKGSAAPFYPIYEAAVYLDLLYNKWGRFSNPHLALYNLLPVNRVDATIMPVKDSGIRGGSLRSDSARMTFFDPASSQGRLKYGRIGNNRQGMTTLTKVVARFSEPPIANLIIETSIDGIAIDSSLSFGISIDGIREVEMPLTTTGKWFNIIIEGTFNLVGLRYEGVATSRR